MKYLLSSYGLNNPYLTAPLADHAVYPVGTEVGSSIDLDYSTLLVGNGYYIDRSCLDYLEENADRLKFLAQMRDSIRALEKEELLQLFDGRRIIGDHSEQILAKTEQLCEDWSGWLETTRRQWEILRKDRENFVDLYGDPQKTNLNRYHNSAINASFRKYGEFNEEYIIEVSRLVESRRKRLTSDEIEKVKEVIRPLVCHTVIQDLFRFKTSASVLDWDDSQGHYERLYYARWDGIDDEYRLAATSRNLFNVSLPQLRPRNVEAVIRFVREEKSVSSLRKEINHLLDEGEAFDEKLGVKLLEETFRRDLAQQNKMKKVRWLGAIGGVLLPGSSILTEAAVEGGIGLAEDGIDSVTGERRRWLYSLLG